LNSRITSTQKERDDVAKREAEVPQNGQGSEHKGKTNRGPQQASAEPQANTGPQAGEMDGIRRVLRKVLQAETFVADVLWKVAEESKWEKSSSGRDGVSESTTQIVDCSERVMGSTTSSFHSIQAFNKNSESGKPWRGLHQRHLSISTILLRQACM
jgi:hypothetical protein